jgi:hypothetical protein
MLLRVRVELPDLPGSLAKVTRILGVLGADVVQITVLERDTGRALDDIVVEWPGGQPRGRLLTALRNAPGVQPIGVWPAASTPEAQPEVDLLVAMVRAPARAVRTLMDTVPLVLAADWACVSDPVGDVVATSWAAPRRPRLPAQAPPRVLGLVDGVRMARAPLPAGQVLTVAREEGPAFHRSELQRVQRLLDVLEALPAEPLRPEGLLTGA